MPPTPDPTYILALDVGGQRIGVAIASSLARLPAPLTTLANNDSFLPELLKLIEHERVASLVIGLPRGLDGQETAQTAAVRAFVEGLRPHVTLPIYWQDEAATSVRAEAELSKRGKIYQKGDVDALAATYILEDFLIHGGTPV